MKQLLLASAIGLAAVSGAFAGASKEATGQPVAQDECDSLWMKAMPKDGKLSETAAAEFITDVKSVNPDGDTTIEKEEFSNACEQGLIKDSAISGAGAGTSGTDAPAEGKEVTP